MQARIAIDIQLKIILSVLFIYETSRLAVASRRITLTNLPCVSVR